MGCAAGAAPAGAMWELPGGNGQRAGTALGTVRPQGMGFCEDGGLGGHQAVDHAGACKSGVLEEG